MNSKRNCSATYLVEAGPTNTSDLCEHMLQRRRTGRFLVTLSFLVSSQKI